MDQSEFDTAPARILLHDPCDCTALDALTPAGLSAQNFLDLPDPSRIRAQHEAFRAELARHAQVVTLGELLNGDPSFAAESAGNPNLMFTRDSSITLPWAPELFCARASQIGWTRTGAFPGRNRAGAPGPAGLFPLR